jgi:magnesium chelatase family protein
MQAEVTLSHNSVLFLDEFPVFSRVVLVVLLQPLEDYAVTTNSVQGSYMFYASFICVALKTEPLSLRFFW